MKVQGVSLLSCWLVIQMLATLLCCIQPLMELLEVQACSQPCVCVCVHVYCVWLIILFIAPMDYTAANQILSNIPAGNSRLNLTIPIQDDDLHELSETFQVQVLLPNSQISAIVVIIDNDREWWILMITKIICMWLADDCVLVVYFTKLLFTYISSIQLLWHGLTDLVTSLVIMSHKERLLSN